jgi:phospholipid/cholesterol/gamma-HCH transport system ATP-binding protein
MTLPRAAAQHERPLIEIRNLSFRRGSRLIFDDISLSIPRGKVTGIMGPSGTGKTTLLKLIGGQLRPDRGEVWVDGQNVHALSRRALFSLRQRIGMLFQHGALLTDLSVFENVAFPLREHTRLPEYMIRDLVLMKLNAVGLRGARDLQTAELSGGMARRVAFARALALDPMLVMFDEPFTGQDPITLGVLLRLIRDLNTALNLTSIVVSHDVAETLTIADHLYVLAEGRVIASGTPQQIQTENSPWVRQFMQGLADGPVPFQYPAAPLLDDFQRSKPQERNA